MVEEPRDLTVRHVTPADAGDWLAMRAVLWTDGSEGAHRADISSFFDGRAKEPLAVLIAHDEEDNAVGFAELSIRAYAEGCRTSQVAYLEGWFVAPDARRRGVGRALVAVAEDWGRSMRCSEFASDAEPTNAVSLAAHRALGFAEVGEIRCFCKEL